MARGTTQISSGDEGLIHQAFEVVITEFIGGFADAIGGAWSLLVEFAFKMVTLDWFGDYEGGVPNGGFGTGPQGLAMNYFVKIMDVAGGLFIRITVGPFLKGIATMLSTFEPPKSMNSTVVTTANAYKMMTTLISNEIVAIAKNPTSTLAAIFQFILARGGFTKRLRFILNGKFGALLADKIGSASKRFGFMIIQILYSAGMVLVCAVLMLAIARVRVVMNQKTPNLKQFDLKQSNPKRWRTKRVRTRETVE